MVLRSDIERALDDLVSNEDGMRFQGLAVILAKQRWRDLVACERKKDLGADAIGSGKVLACSLTAKLGKIKGDAAKIKTNFDDRIKTLLFATAEGVTNATAKSWVEEIRKEFDYELVVVSREDLIASLMDPGNVTLCRTHLGIAVTFEQPVEELLQRTREAASELTQAWWRRLAGRPLIDLGFMALQTDGSYALDLSDIERWMAQGRRIVIEAPAGRGKTTTLIQLANRRNQSGGVALLIDLPGWAKSGRGILEHVSGMTAFQSRSINTEELARLQKVEQFSFLLNGWNEIAESDSAHALHALRELERDFPAAGILVATRAHHVIPRLPGALRVRLLPVNRAQRRIYLVQRLGARAEELCTRLEKDTTLDDLTRTPLVLSEVASIFEAGQPIPETKMGVLGTVMHLIEESDEHGDHLKMPPLSGRAEEYLSGLAASMTREGKVELQEDDARTIASSVATRLRDTGQIAALPEPQAVLGSLCARHVLERQAYPVPSFRFEHQQFQEYYAALVLNLQLFALIRKGDSVANCEYTKSYVNEPAWSEPMRMVANDIGVSASAGDANAARAGALLITMALNVDPVYAAELAYRCGASVWKEICADVAQRLRAMYAVSDEHSSQLALAGMLASGSDDFRDIVLSLLTNENQQVRLATYRTWPDFHVSSIGEDWEKTVRSWNEEIRMEFVSELLHFGNVRETIMSFALADPSIKVRATGISAFVWGASREETAKLLCSVDDATFKAALYELPLEAIPAEVRSRALEVYEESYEESTDPVDRLRKLLVIGEVGGANVIGRLKDELQKCPRGTLEQLGRYVIRPALDLVRPSEPEWVSHWVAERIVDGSLHADYWIALVSTIPGDMQEGLLQSIETQDFEHARYSGRIAVLAAIGDPGMVERIFGHLCTVRRAIASDPHSAHDLECAVERQLEDLFHSLPVNVAVNGLAKRISGDVEPLELMVITRLFGRVFRRETDLRGTLRHDLRRMLRGYLVRGVRVMLREADFNGEKKAELACSLAEVGEPEDMALLWDLITADIARRRRGMEARLRGDRGKLGNGAAMSYAGWHVRAVLQLAPQAADAVLLETLKEPEYERESAWGLVQLATITHLAPGLGPELGYRRRTDYGQIWDARQGRLPLSFNEQRRKCYAVAIRERIESILEESARTGQARAYDFRLKELAKALAVIDSHGSTSFILRLLGSQDSWNGWPVVQTLDTLLFNGIVLPTDETLKIFDTLLGHVRSHLWNAQEVDLLIRALCLLPFIENTHAGIAKIREVVKDLKLRTYEMRDVAGALGHSRCPEAIELLREFASDQILIKQMGEAWVNSVATLDSPESRQLLLSFVDPELSGLPAGLTFERDEVQAARLAELARRDAAIQQRLLQLCTMQLPPLKRALLAKVMGGIGTVDAILGGLNLIDDGAVPPLPYEVWKQIEETFVERRSINPESNAYTPAPRSSNRVRRRLFEMTKGDDRRNRTASSLLAQIEIWRLEYGRPYDEPTNPDLECEGSLPPERRRLGFV